ncbi:triose-phosphate isomerase [Patescibacteria group bacterium]|nr:triose-phosphate isomerase [Patescibacteria group bacterium]MCG2695233.1 triose-phosphate isomerase [Candidatus Parcubacteria bacterium]
MKKDKKIIIANWKMNPESLIEAKKMFLGIKKTAGKLSGVQTVVCPPYIYLNELVSLYKGHRVAIGAQNVFSENKGSFTGAVSPNMLKKNKVDYVIVGHSERRALGEDNQIINEKIKASLRSGLNVIFCVGEKERDENAKYFDFLKNEILDSLEGVNAGSLKNILVAYEPIWAISNNSGGKAVLPSEIQEMVIFIKKVLSDRFGIKTKMPQILYGGSVNPKNTKEILEEGGVDGLLVGKASLDAGKFGEILKIANI